MVGSLLEKNLLKAVEMASKQRQVANDFTATFPPKTVQNWRCMVKEWEADPSYPNPYVLKEQGMFSQNHGVNVSYCYLFQHRRFLRHDYDSLKKRPQRQKGGKEHLTRSLRQYLCAWALNLRINSTFLCYNVISGV